MKFLQLLVVPLTVFFGGVAGTYISTTSCVSATVTSTLTTTVSVTVTQASTVYVTETGKEPCPAYQTSVLNFDDLITDSVSPMPSVYQDFEFSAGWQYYTRDAFDVNSWEYLSVYTPPNALMSQCYGLVSISSRGRGFTFDMISAAFAAYSPNVPENSTLIVELQLLMSDEYLQKLYFEHPNGLNGTKPFLLSEDELAGFVDLVEISVAVWQTYNNETGEGIPAIFMIDDIEYVKRKCDY